MSRCVANMQPRCYLSFLPSHTSKNLHWFFRHIMYIIPVCLSYFFLRFPFKVYKGSNLPPSQIFISFFEQSVFPINLFFLVCDHLSMVDCVFSRLVLMECPRSWLFGCHASTCSIFPQFLIVSFPLFPGLAFPFFVFHICLFIHVYFASFLFFVFWLDVRVNDYHVLVRSQAHGSMWMFCSGRVSNYLNWHAHYRTFT